MEGESFSLDSEKSLGGFSMTTDLTRTESKKKSKISKKKAEEISKICTRIKNYTRQCIEVYSKGDLESIMNLGSKLSSTGEEIDKIKENGIKIRQIAHRNKKHYDIKTLNEIFKLLDEIMEEL